MTPAPFLMPWTAPIQWHRNDCKWLSLPVLAKLQRRRGRCQSKIDYFAQASESYFATVDFPGFFRIKPSGSTHFSSIQNFALTVPSSRYLVFMSRTARPYPSEQRRTGREDDET
jgi:hypothetical protein